MRLLASDDGACNFDRISLGLLPSSEGGWSVAISCLDRGIGGWLHVHGNVKTAERLTWTNWLCRSLANVSAVSRRRGERRNVCRGVDGEDDGCDATFRTTNDDDNTDEEEGEG